MKKVKQKRLKSFLTGFVSAHAYIIRRQFKYFPRCVPSKGSTIVRRVRMDAYVLSSTADAHQLTLSPGSIHSAFSWCLPISLATTLKTFAVQTTDRLWLLLQNPTLPAVTRDCQGRSWQEQPRITPSNVEPQIYVGVSRWRRVRIALNNYQKCPYEAQHGIRKSSNEFRWSLSRHCEEKNPCTHGTDQEGEQK